MQHLDEGTIHAWLDGALDDVNSARVAQHAATCAECAAMIAEARGMIAGATRVVSMLDGVRGGVIPSVPPLAARPSLWRSLAITPVRAALAASLLIATATIFTARHDTADKMVPHRTASFIDSSPPRVAIAAPTSAPPPPASGSSSSAASTVAAARVVPNAQEPSKRMEPTIEPAAPTAVAAAAAAPIIAAPSAARPTVAAQVIAAPAVAAQVAAPPVAAETRVGTNAKLANKSIVMDSASTSADGALRARMEARSASSDRPAMGAMAASAMRLQAVVPTSAGSPPASLVGCYRLAGDSAAWPRLVPSRFALNQIDSAHGAPRNVLRTVTADGRLDSVVSGSSWRQLSSNAATLNFAAPALSRSPWQTVTLRLTSNGSFLIAAPEQSSSRTIPLEHADCHP